MLLGEALAGTGKTTTVKWGLGIKVPRGIKVTDEQKKIITLMRSYKWKTCAAQAFNTSIADKLKREVPAGVDAATSNAFGHRAWLEHIGRSSLKPDAYKTNTIFKDMAKADKIAYDDIQWMEAPVVQLVKLCKSYLKEPDNDTLDWLCARFDIDPDPRIYSYTERVFKEGLKDREWIDFDDQNFMPLWFNVKLPKYDLVVGDEVQDLTIAKQEMAFRMLGPDGQFVGIGDRHQAIYGFSGADSDAMDTLWERMLEMDSSSEKLPLTITQRCPKAVVKEAQIYVPHFRAADSAPDGLVARIPEREATDDRLLDRSKGYMVLCRTNAPLTGLAFRLIGQNRRCFIQGRDIGNGMKREVTKYKDCSFKIAVGKALERIDERIEELEKKKFKNEQKIEAQRDRRMCIRIISDQVESLDQYVKKIDELFKDYGDPKDVRLSSVHKAKGLEHPDVMIYKPSKLPLIIRRKTRTGKISSGPAFQVQQEKNLAYVAYTRSMENLTFLKEEEKRKAYDYDDE